MRPGVHSESNGDGTALAPSHWNRDKTLELPRDNLKPFFDQYLKDGPKANTPPVLIYNTSDNRWDRGFAAWPPGKPTPIYLTAGYGLSFTAADAAKGAAYDEYVSDPAKP